MYVSAASVATAFFVFFCVSCELNTDVKIEVFASKMQVVITVLLLNNMNIISRIQELADNKGISMYNISQDTGISQSVLSRLKNNKTAKLSRLNLEILAQYFGVNSNWLATGEGKKYRTELLKGPTIDDERLRERIEELAIKLFSIDKTSSKIDYKKMSATIAIPPERLYSIILNNDFPTYKELLRIATIRNLSIEWLITGNGPMLKPDQSATVQQSGRNANYQGTFAEPINTIMGSGNSIGGTARERIADTKGQNLAQPKTEAIELRHEVEKLKAEVNQLKGENKVLREMVGLGIRNEPVRNI